MGILERTKHVIRADLNDLLKRAKNPKVVLEAYLDDIEGVLAEALRLREAEDAELGIYQSRLRDVQSAQKTLEQKAKTCLQREDEELARTALERKFNLQEDVDELSREISQRHASRDILEETVLALKARMAEVKRRRREVRFHQQILQARTELQHSLQRLGNDQDDAILTEAHDEMAAWESRIQAEESMQRHDLDQQVLRLEMAERRRDREAAIDKEIDRLRSKNPKGKGG